MDPHDPHKQHGPVDTDPGAPPTFEAGDVRQGEIILTTRRRRAIFIAGLILAILVALVLAVT